MINKTQFSNRKARADEFLVELRQYLISPYNPADDNEDIEAMLSHLDSNNVVFEKYTNSLTFTFGDYNFIVKPRINVASNIKSAIIDTVHVTNHAYSFPENYEQEYSKVAKLEMSIDHAGKLVMAGAEENVYKHYVVSLIQYITSLEDNGS